MAKRLEALQQMAKFNVLYGPKAIEDSAIFVRVPQVFKNPLVVGSVAADKPVDARRAGFPFLTLLTNYGKSKVKSETWESLVIEQTGATLSYCFYPTVVVDPALQASLRGPGQDRMENNGGLWQMLAKAFPAPAGKVGSWEDVACPTPSGNTVPWQKIRAEGEQEFYALDSQGNVQMRKAPGVVEIYARTEAESLVLLIWRMPLSLEPSGEMARLAPLVCGSLTSQPGAAPLQAPPQADPGAAPQGAPGVPPQGAPGVPPQGAPAVPPEAAPGVPPQATPGVPPQAVPGVAPQGTPGVAPQAAPGVPSQAAPGAPPQAAPGAPAPGAPPPTTPQ